MVQADLAVIELTLFANGENIRDLLVCSGRLPLRRPTSDSFSIVQYLGDNARPVVWSRFAASSIDVIIASIPAYPTYEFPATLDIVAFHGSLTTVTSPSPEVGLQ